MRTVLTTLLHPLVAAGAVLAIVILGVITVVNLSAGDAHQFSMATHCASSPDGTNPVEVPGSSVPYAPPSGPEVAPVYANCLATESALVEYSLIDRPSRQSTFHAAEIDLPNNHGDEDVVLSLTISAPVDSSTSSTAGDDLAQTWRGQIVGYTLDDGSTYATWADPVARDQLLLWLEGICLVLTLTVFAGGRALLSTDEAPISLQQPSPAAGPP